MLKLEVLPLPGTRVATSEVKYTSSNVPLSTIAKKKYTLPVGGPPLAAVTVPFTVTARLGEVLVAVAVPAVVVTTPVNVWITTG